MPNSRKKAKNGGVNYKEYDESERKHNTMNLEIKQESEEEESPQMPNSIKKAKNGGVNYKEYDESERKHNTMKLEIKQEPEEVPEICPPAQVQTICGPSSEGSCPRRKRIRTVPAILEEELKVRLEIAEEEKVQKLQQHAARLKLCRIEKEIAEEEYQVAVMERKIAEARLQQLLTDADM